MCTVVDTGAFSKVFDETNKEHHKFKPVRDWIIDGTGKVIYGGTKYKDELKEGRRARFLAELERRGKTVRLPTRKVDDISAKLKKIEPDDDFDDEHLVAIVIASKFLGRSSIVRVIDI